MKPGKTKISCILFDLDGTILNTNDLVLESLQYTIRTCLKTEVEPQRLYKYFGVPLVKIMADFDPVQAEKMCMIYREYSAGRHDRMIKIFPHVRETLKKLYEKDIPVAVVTSKLRDLALRGLQLFQLDSFIDTVIAFEDTEEHKPEPAPILKALDKLGIQPEDGAIMVGDSPYDIGCAHNAGVFSAVVDWTLHSREELTRLSPDIWISDFHEVLNYV